MKSLNIEEYIVSGNKINSESLRKDLYDYFNTLHYMLSDTEFDQISAYAKGWIDANLLTPEHFENSIRSKAHDISSGNDLTDYYHALLIRHDQLLAARDVFREYTSLLRGIFSDEREGVIKKLKVFDFDNGIYLRAIEYQKNRESLFLNYEKSLEMEIIDIENEIAAVDNVLTDKLDEIQLSNHPVKSTNSKAKVTPPTKKMATGKSARLFHKSI